MYKNVELFVFHISSLPGSSVQRAGEEPCVQNHQDSDRDQHRLLALRVSGKYSAVRNGLWVVMAILPLDDLVKGACSCMPTFKMLYKIRRMDKNVFYIDRQKPGM